MAESARFFSAARLDVLLQSAARSDVLVAAALAAYVPYVALNWGLNRRPRVPRLLGVAHNCVLALYSLVYFCALLFAVLRVARDLTPWGLACSAATFSDAPLVRLYAINVAARLYELLDTVLIVHGSRPLTFLHVYHHACTLLIAHLNLVDQSAPMWFVILFNAFVHFFMYSYYAACAAGIRVAGWAKRLVTVLQIVQFVAVLAFYVPTCYVYFAYNGCSTTARAALVSLAVLGSYLILFARFYKQTYATTPVKVDSRRKEA
jgi:fatty acid elongase 3